MKFSYLPSDGSITIIDDNINEVTPFFDLFSFHGIPFTFYSGEEANIPLNPSQKIRLAFIDIQLVPGLTAHAYAQNILQILSKLISSENGPYIAAIWSKKEHIYFRTIQEELLSQQYPLRPLFVLKMKKRNYINEVKDTEFIDHFKETIEELKTRFDDRDIEYFNDRVIQTLPKKLHYKIIPNAISKIEKQLEKELKKTEIFNLLTAWEKSIYSSTQKTLFAITKIYDYNQYWQNNSKHLIYSMAQAVVGKKIKRLSKIEILKNSITLLNQSFIESNNSQFQINTKLERDINISSRNNFCEFLIESHVIKISHTNFEKYSVHIDGVAVGGSKDKHSDLFKLGRNPEEKILIKSAVDLFLRKNPVINTNLHLNLKPEPTLFPASIVLRKVYGENKRKLLQNYFVSDGLFKKNDNIFSVTSEDLRKIKFVELEVTPICDFAQNKIKKNRFISGLLYPLEFAEKCKANEFNKSLYFYDVKPEFFIDETIYKLVFDFRFLKTIKITHTNEVYKNPYLRLKSELYSDILSKLSIYMNRPGITFLE